MKSDLHLISDPFRFPDWCVRIGRSSAWRSARELSASELTEQLTCPKSLTLRLQQQFGKSFRFRQICQGWQPAATAVWYVLGGSKRPWALLRTVAMYREQKLCVVAQSAIPAAAIAGKLRRLRCLGDQPLGKILHKIGRTSRTAFQFAVVRTESPLGPSRFCWARRSVLQSLGHRIPVMEVFLDPDIIGLRGNVVSQVENDAHRFRLAFDRATHPFQDTATRLC